LNFKELAKNAEMLQKRSRYVPFFMILSISSPFFKQMSFYIENPMSDRDDINTSNLSNQHVVDFGIWLKKTIAFKKSHFLANITCQIDMIFMYIIILTQTLNCSSMITHPC
jgi:hypothetical protein